MNSLSNQISEWWGDLEDGQNSVAGNGVGGQNLQEQQTTYAHVADYDANAV